MIFKKNINHKIDDVRVMVNYQIRTNLDELFSELQIDFGGLDIGMPSGIERIKMELIV